MRKSLNIAIAVGAVALLGGSLAGCKKAATGQVVAVVNGDEITLPELNAELAGVNLPPGVDKTKVRAAALQRIVERHLVAQQAKADGLDRDPDYLIRQRQLNDTLLVELFAKKARDTIAVPDRAAVDRFIATNPAAFGGRVIFAVDQLRIPPQDAAFVQSLKGLKTLDAMVAMLKGRGIQFERSPTRIDSAQVDPATLAQVKALPAGEPFVVAVPQGITASVITGREAAPMVPERAQAAAAQLVRNQNLGKLLEGRLKEMKAKAKITYQPGYAPPPATANPTPAPGAR